MPTLSVSTHLVVPRCRCSVLGSQLPSQTLTALYYLLMDVVILSQYTYYTFYYQRRQQALQARAHLSRHSLHLHISSCHSTPPQSEPRYLL